jgi:hypothetical protein
VIVWVTTSVGIGTMTMPCKIFLRHFKNVLINLKHFFNLKTFFLVLAFWILSYDWSFEIYEGFLFKPWRLVLLTYTIPGIIGALILLTKLRPSPKFLLSVKRDSEALETLKWIYRENTGKEFQVMAIKSEEGDVAKKR